MRFIKGLALGVSAAAICAAGAYAQDNEDDDTLVQERVTVTGSAIAGTPEDAALPVDVLTAADLQLEGNPSITELIRNLGVSSGVDGQTNQFASNGLEGTSNVNLRGLGPGRTLVLINGRRQTYHPYSIGEQAQLFIDTNMIPSAAVGRIEVLKDGAAAVYGSDAIAGVVNFITRDDFEGFEIGGDYSTFEGTDGNYNINAAYGMQGTNWSWVTSAGYNFRSEVPLLEKDWAIRPYEENPVGGWSSISNPGVFIPQAITATGPQTIGLVPDAGCTDVGGTLVPNATFGGLPTCHYQFAQFDNLVEEEERWQVFSEYNRTFGNGVNLHLEGMYGYSDVPSWKTSPSYPPQVLTGQLLFPNHPGLQQYVADNPDAAVLSAADAIVYFGRSFALGGFPGTGYSSQEGYRTYESWRGSGSLDGQFDNGVNWDTALSYSTTEGERITNDTYILGFTAALRGFGVCTDAATGNDPATGTQPFAAGYTGSLVAGQGACEYYNPFSNAIPADAISGDANPSYNPDLENSLALADYLTDGVGSVTTTDLLVWDATLSGTSGVQAAGGSIGWAAGVQVRRESYEVDPNEVTDLTVSPGPGGTGPFSFLAGTTPADRDQTIYAVFGELQVPLFENVDMQFAVRYEDYGGEVGSTFDPKVAGKWQVTDSLALRGSAQTSFKGPTLNQLDGVGTTLQFIAPTSAFKAVDTFGNPSLNPESAFSFNLGALFENASGFTASVDYYNFDFSDPIIVEDQAAIVAAVQTALASPSTDDDAILNRITFQDANGDGMNQANEISRVRTNVVNGPDIKTSGVDVRAEQVWDLGASEFTVGGEATYIIEYDVGDFLIEGVVIPGGDRVDQFNRSNFSRSLPQWKANIFANWNLGNHNFRGVMRHIDSYDDERPASARGGIAATIDSQTTFDLFYNWQSDWDFDLGLSVVNVTDEDPPLAAFDLSYDPYTHNPFGRTFKVSLTKRFGG